MYINNVCKTTIILFKMYYIYIHLRLVDKYPEIFTKKKIFKFILCYNIYYENIFFRILSFSNNNK